MKNSPSLRAALAFHGSVLLGAILALATPAAHAGLSLELHVYRNSQGQNYAFYTPLSTNSTGAAAPLGTYIISSYGWPTNGSRRAFDLTASGLSDRFELDSEHFYNNFASTIHEITNGPWSIMVTNATSTNAFSFSVNGAGMTSNMLPATVISLPADGTYILTSQTDFLWQGPSTWPVTASAQTYNDFYYRSANIPPGQTNWSVDTSIPAGTNYTFRLQYLTNVPASVLNGTVPANTNTLAPISGWVFTAVLDSGSSVAFAVSSPGAPYAGHTCLAYYTFEDNNLFAQDFSGNGNNISSYAWFGAPPTIVTNDGVSGTYAAGFGGSGWLVAPTNLQATLARSFSVSLWLKTTNVHGLDTDDQYSSAGIVSALTGNYNQGVMPMGQSGHKLAFYTGGSLLNTMHSRSNINTGHYVHVVTTRDQQTGEKRIYINGVLDSAVYSSRDLLDGAGANEIDIGYNNSQVFTGEMDEIQLYSGVLSASDIAYLHSHVGSKVADTLELAVPLARFDFEQTNSPGTDSSGHHNDSNCSDGDGDPDQDIPSTNAAVGAYAREYFGASRLCFAPGPQSFQNLSNALSGDFSVTAWVNTTSSTNFDYANAYFGLPIIFAYSSTTNSTVPLAITGSKAAFTVFNETGNGITLHSTTTVNDGNYHFLAVTRTQTNGAMTLYVDGVAEDTGTSSTQPLVIPTFYLAGGYFTGYKGLLDDVRIYAGALGAEDVANLSGHPSFNTALNTTGLPWATSGDTSWFTETTNTYDGVAAAQSGVVTNGQSSTLSVTITGPGTLTFWWQNVSADTNIIFDLEFDIDHRYANDLYGTQSWTQDGPYTLDGTTHTLSWTAFAGDLATDVGYLDQVVFTPASPVALAKPQNDGSNFKFQFMSLNGFNHAIQYRTNLVAGQWQTYSTIGGDGSLKNISIPLTVFNASKQGFVRVTTQ